jgi:hypothetical protein
VTLSNLAPRAFCSHRPHPCLRSLGGDRPVFSCPLGDLPRRYCNLNAVLECGLDGLLNPRRTQGIRSPPPLFAIPARPQAGARPDRGSRAHSHSPRDRGGIGTELAVEGPGRHEFEQVLAECADVCRGFADRGGHPPSAGRGLCVARGPRGAAPSS